MAYAAVTVLQQNPDGSGQWVTSEAARVPHQWVEQNPSRQMVQVLSKPLPVPAEIDSWSILHVL